MTIETPLELFRRACGLVAPITLSYRSADSPDDAPTILESPEPFLLIGRGEKNKIALADRQVSLRHVYVQAVAGGVAWADLKSRAGTFADDEAEARPWGWLEPGHSIRVGPVRIERTDRLAGAATDPTSPNPFATADDPESPPRAFFELPFRVGGIATTWEVPGLVALVGREDHSQLVLQDDSISRTHACLVRTPMGVWVVDLGERSGVHVNGTRVLWAWLADGDQVRLGLFSTVIRYDRPPEGIDRALVPLKAGAALVTDLETTGEPGTVLAVRPAERPPASLRTSRTRPAEPAILDRGEWEPVPGTAPGPYALWQQQIQLMESFHQDMTMMVQMFLAMHREFQSSIREELARVQGLTEELSRLHAQLVPPSVSTETRPAPPTKARPGRRSSGEGPKDRTGHGATGKTPATHRVDPPSGAGPGRRAEAASAPEPSPKPEDARKGPTVPRESAEMYADLTRRITELQRERRGYWQRILKSING